MFNFKNILLLAALLNSIYASICLNSDEILNQTVSQVIKPDEAEVKINWAPVWDDVEGNNEFVTRHLDESDNDDNQNCLAPNGLGLQNLLQEVEKILPKQQIKTIVKSYSEDPEVKTLKAFVTNPQTQVKVQAIYNSKEYQILKDYSCRILHIDLNKYHKLARTLVNPLITRSGPQPTRRGIRGLINEVNAILPRQQLRELYLNLLAIDDELVKAVANLKSKQFHQLLLNIKHNVPEYKVLRQQLSALGVPVEEMRELFANSLGWSPELDLFV